MARPTDETGKKGMDPLKAYCLVLGFLVLVLGVLWIKIRGDRDDYAAANARAEQFLTGQGLQRGSDGRPRSIPDIAYEVEQYVETYKGTAQEGGIATGIPLELMRNMATLANMTQESAANERVDPNKAAGYQTTSREFDYKATTLKNLVTLVWNVESRGRYRVSEIRWELADAKDNSAAPYHAVKKPRIKVAVRTPVTRER